MHSSAGTSVASGWRGTSLPTTTVKRPRKPRVLFLEDDRETGSAVAAGLAARGYEVEWASDTSAALAACARRRIDAAILDLMVPGEGGGYTVLEHLRVHTPEVLVLILTARDRVEDRVEGLVRGADDYLVKPFAFIELAARLTALLRRPPTRTDLLRVRQLEIDPLRRRASGPELALDLTQKEFDLLFCLASRRGEVLTRRELLATVWDTCFDPGTNVVDVHVTRLRRKLEAAGCGDLIRTVRGVGYTVDD